MTSKAISAYLSRHAESQAVELAAEISGSWRVAVSIPACGEGEGLIATLKSLRAAEAAAGSLIIVLVNAAVDAASHHHRANELTLSLFEVEGPGPLWLTQWQGMDVVLWDKASESRRLPRGQGVGLARKLGADLALALYVRGVLESPWLRTTDADVQVPHDYLIRALPQGCAAALFAFVHDVEGDEAQRLSMTRYEAYLHYYTAGLRWAGSHYAYTAIGSAIAVHLSAYAMVRGFPKRQAGEDFYLLNKLAKVGPVRHMAGAPIHVRGRLSDRVPFGTGAALLDMVQSEAVYRVYAPESFQGLRLTLHAWSDFACHWQIKDLTAALAEAERHCSGVVDAAAAIGLMKAAEKIAAQQGAVEPKRRRLREWFDAFRTLKWMHHIRDHNWPARALSEALDSAGFVDRQDPSNESTTLLERVAAMGQGLTSTQSTVCGPLLSKGRPTSR
ncbi:MAG TPA: hypothetical protein DCQ06_14400 [Myxococcales bacterium]|nr:hypothetical protein [Myxococcales bacterium]